MVYRYYVSAYETYQQCYIPAGMNNNQIRMLKPPVVLENINHNDANNYLIDMKIFLII